MGTRVQSMSVKFSTEIIWQHQLLQFNISISFLCGLQIEGVLASFNFYHLVFSKIGQKE